jgi:hypothetical protein
VRHQNGARPSFKDNINFLALDRVLAHYGIADQELPMTNRALLKNFQFYARVLREHDEFLQGHGWFDRERMLANEHKIYVLTGDWKRNDWLEELTEKVAALIGNGDVVTWNSNELPPWDLCRHMVEACTISGDVVVRVSGGHGAVDPRDHSFGVTLITPGGSSSASTVT